MPCAASPAAGLDAPAQRSLALVGAKLKQQLQREIGLAA